MGFFVYNFIYNSTPFLDKRACFIFYRVLTGQVFAYSISMLEFLPEYLKIALRNLNSMYVYEIRLRCNQPILINYKGYYVYLSNYGVTDKADKALQATKEDVDECIYRAGNFSVYSVEEQIKKGFLTAANGERIGIAGEYVYEKGKPLAIKNHTSLCIRVPHEIIGCAEKIYEICMRERVRSVLLGSSPGLGKTTILRDLGRILGEKTKKNVLICDERGEISAGDCGECSDVIKYSDKKTAFEAGIRAMRPDIMITDELSLHDCEALRKAVYAGVKVIASAHFSDIAYISEDFLSVFEYFVFLREEKIGEIKEIYQKTQTGVVRV